MNREQAERECALDCLTLGLKAIAENEFGLGALHLENAARSLKELERIRRERANDKVLLVGTILHSRNIDGHN